MRIIGVTGGVGSGKSSILRYLNEVYQAVIIEADEVGRRAQSAGEEAFQMIVDQFGQDAVGINGELDRAFLAELIYDDDAKRNLMNSIVHPIVTKHILNQIEAERIKGTTYVVVEAAILFESKLNKICDEVWYIYANESVRIERLMTNRHYSKEKCQMIMDSQLRHEEFIKLSNVCIDNSLTLEYAYKQIDEQFIRIKDEMKNEIM